MSLLSRLRPAPKNALAILGFHNITPTFTQPYISASFPMRFRQLCRVVKKRFEVVTVSDAITRLSAGETPKKPFLSFIFDDGYADTYDVIMPIMRSEGLVGTSYVVVDCMKTGQAPWYEELGRIIFETSRAQFDCQLGGEEKSWDLPPKGEARNAVFWDAMRTFKKLYDTNTPALIAKLADEHLGGVHDPKTKPMMMDTEKVKGLIAAGWEVGCHSQSHPILPALNDQGLEQEIKTAGEELASLIDHKVTSFCYPNGDNDQRCIDQVEKAGYLCAVSMQCGANRPQSWNPYHLKRAAMSEDLSFYWPWHTTYRIHAALVDETP